MSYGVKRMHIYIPELLSDQDISNCQAIIKTGQLQLNSYPGKFLSRFYILHINIYNLHLIHKTNCQNKQTYMFQM